MIIVNRGSLKPGFYILVFAATVLTASALFTPAWRGDYGIITRHCTINCGHLWNGQPSWLKAVIIFMFVALIAELLILIWAGLTFLEFCLAGIYYPLAALCSIATFCLCFAVILYAAKDSNEMNGYRGDNTVGYSFWFATIAASLMLAATATSGGISNLFGRINT